MSLTLSVFILLGTLVPCAHTLTGMWSVSRPVGSLLLSTPSSGRVHMFEPIGKSTSERPQRRNTGVSMASEEVGVASLAMFLFHRLKRGCKTRTVLRLSLCVHTVRMSEIFLRCSERGKKVDCLSCPRSFFQGNCDILLERWLNPFPFSLTAQTGHHFF